MSDRITGCPKDGDVADFVKLHLDTAVEQGKHPYYESVNIYRVDGKARPMLVVTPLSRRKRGRLWFLVLPITTKGRGEDGEVRQDVEPIGKSIDAHTESFVECQLLQLPDNLLCTSGGQGAVRRRLDRLTFDSILRLARQRAMRAFTGSL